MAEEGGGGGTSDVMFVVLVLIVLVGAFFLTGAYKNATVGSLFVQFPGANGTSTFPTIKVPSVDMRGAPGVSSGFDRNETNIITREVAAVSRDVASLKTIPASPYAGKVLITATRSNTNAGEEYVTLRASRNNTTGVPVTGWRLESAVSGHSAFIRGGSTVFRDGISQAGGAIVLQPGDAAFISSSRSPVGVSFHVNKCSGYLAQFQAFTPALSSDCPRPEKELDVQPDRALYADNDCYNYLSSLRRCTIDLTPASDLSNACRNFIYNNITYQACVNAHQYDFDFLEPEWRVYLGYDSTLWRNEREVIALLDENGKLVDSITY